MPGLWAGIWIGSLRTVKCPNGGRKQVIARRSFPFEVSCKFCRHPMRVTAEGVVAQRTR